MARDLIIREHRRELTKDEWEEIKKLIPPNRKHPVVAYAIEITKLGWRES